MKGMHWGLAAAVLLVLASCNASTSTEPAATTPPAAIEQATAPTSIDEELAKRIGLLQVDAGLSADMLMVQAEMARLGGTYTYVQLIEDAAAARSKAVDDYVAVIRDVPVEDLRDALKDGLTANSTFYDTVANAQAMGSRQWVSSILEAREAIRQADARIGTEKTLATAP